MVGERSLDRKTRPSKVWDVEISAKEAEEQGDEPCFRNEFKSSIGYQFSALVDKVAGVKTLSRDRRYGEGNKLNL